MKKLFQILYLTMGLIGITPAQAKDQWTFMGVGTESCGQFAEQYREGPQATDLVFFSWAQGYMSGLNDLLEAQGQLKKDLNGVPTEDQRRFIRSYCDAHPLANYSSAVYELLMKKLPLVTPTGH